MIFSHPQQLSLSYPKVRKLIRNFLVLFWRQNKRPCFWSSTQRYSMKSVWTKFCKFFFPFFQTLPKYNPTGSFHSCRLLWSCSHDPTIPPMSYCRWQEKRVGNIWNYAIFFHDLVLGRIKAFFICLNKRGIILKVVGTFNIWINFRGFYFSKVLRVGVVFHSFLQPNTASGYVKICMFNFIIQYLI